MTTPTLDPHVIAQWLSNGFLVVQHHLDHSSIQSARVDAEAAFAAPGARGAGIRDALRWPALRSLAHSPPILTLAHALLDDHAAIVRAILFDKSPNANWDVPWHQDTTIAVQQRADVPGFGPWSVKAGIPHVQPPADVLERVATIRIHLDDCGPDNGPLLVVPASHLAGILRDPDPADCDSRSVCCDVPAGGIVAMRPLLLHASRRSTAPSHRRVLHLEFASGPLPGGLQWATA